MTRTNIRWILAACLQAALLCTAQAQLLEEIELRREGDHAVVQVRFVTPVQLQRTVSSSNGQSVQIFYGVLPTSERLNQITSERNINGLRGLPNMLLTDESVARDNVSRRLRLRFGEDTRYRVRAGRDRQGIEIVLEGRGAAISALTPTQAAVPASLATAASSQGYAVRLQSSNEPGQPMRASVPAEFQDKSLYTSQRVINGRNFYEINLGYFPTQAVAESARARLERRFPGATVIDLRTAVPPARPTAAAVVPPSAAPASPAPSADTPKTGTAPALVAAVPAPMPVAPVVPLPQAATPSAAAEAAVPSPQ
ncbi:MAG: hypothetical protein ABL896_13835, partial [Hylemonella sp.]